MVAKASIIKNYAKADSNKYTVKQMCKVLKFPRSTYYAVIP